MTGIVCVEIGVLADLCLRMIQTHAPGDVRGHEKEYSDVKELEINKEVYTGMLIYCLGAGSYIEIFLKHWNWYGQLACGIFGAYLLVASIQDLQSCQVYDFLHLLAAPVGLLVMLVPPTGPGEVVSLGSTQQILSKLLSLLIFAGIQIGLFMRMYGAADGFVFMVCAVYESRFGEGLLTYLLHMGAAYLVLGVVQGFRRNINSRGNLKKPVPFVPYIAATVWLFL